MQINFKRSLINWIHRKKSVLVSVETLELRVVRTVLNVAGQGFKFSQSKAQLPNQSNQSLVFLLRLLEDQLTVKKKFIDAR